MTKKCFLLFFLFSVVGYLQPLISHSEDSSLPEILSNAGDIIYEDAEGKIYIDTENISVSENGIYLNLENGDSVELPYLFGDSQGCYITHLSIKVTKPCPF